METTVSSKHLEVTDAIKTYVLEKIGKLPRYFDRITSIEALMDKNNNHDFEVEIIVHAEMHDPFVCTVHGEDLYHCVAECVKKVERMLTDHKEKLRNRKHNVG